MDIEHGSMNLSGPSRENDRVHMIGVVFSEDGSKIATTSWDGFVEVWDVKTGAQISWLINTESQPIFGLDMHGGQLVSTSASSIRISDVTTGEVSTIFAGHSNAVYGVAFSPDGTLLASSSLDRKVKIWDVATGAALLTLAGHQGAVNEVVFRPDGLQVASASSDGDVLIWDLGPAREVYTITTPDAFSRITVSKDGKWMAEGVGLDAKVWETETGVELVSLRHELLVNAVAFSPDGQQLVTTDTEGGIHVWDIERQINVLNMKKGSSILNAVAFSPDGTKIASGGEDNVVQIWDSHNGDLIFTLRGHAYPITSLAISPDGKSLISGGVDNIAILWDIENGEKINTLRGHTDVVWGMDFSADGKRIVTASRDSTVKVWDVDSAKELLTLQGHTGTVVSAVFSPDDKQIASASMDGLTNVWNADTGELLLTLYGNGSGVKGVEFTPNGKFIITTSDALRSYLVDVSDLMELARSRLTRSLTTQECQQYLHMDTCLPTP
jgi:WD40 repeat protein